MTMNLYSFIVGPKERAITLQSFIDNLGKDVDMAEIDNEDSDDQLNSNNINNLHERRNGRWQVNFCS